MTYCVAVKLKKGLIFMSDTRTNAGVDDISQVQKVHSWEVPGERAVVLLAAGNLATTQIVVSTLEERARVTHGATPSIVEATSMFQIAKLVGDTLREVITTYSPSSPPGASPFSATFILGGQVGDTEPRLFFIYPQGNFIETGEDSPFFQSGETKYGRPMLVRALDINMTFEAAIKLLCVSFDSTIRANAGVDLPIDLRVVPADTRTISTKRRFDRDDPYYTQVSREWSQALNEALAILPDFTF